MLFALAFCRITEETIDGRRMLVARTLFRKRFVMSFALD